MGAETVVESRQINASINLYPQMEGLSPSRKIGRSLAVRRLKVVMSRRAGFKPYPMNAGSGFTLTGEEAYEGSDESSGLCMFIKHYIA